MDLVLQAIKALFRKIDAQRTHYDTRVFETVTLTFDGNMEGRETIGLGDGRYYVKISGDPIPVEELVGASVTVFDVGGTVTEIVTQDAVSTPAANVVAWGTGEVLVALADAQLNGLSFSRGVWVVLAVEDGAPVYYVSSIVRTRTTGELKRLPDKFLPEWVGRRISAAQATADEAQAMADEAQTTADGKMSANNPVGTGSFSMGRKSGTTVGGDSHAEGYSATASGYASHAEGYSATASGYASHAEGNSTKASGNYSHAEGDGTEASGYASHAEGYGTTATYGKRGAYILKSGDASYAHAEGYKTAAADVAAHAEGNGTTASGPYSHAEGLGTTASGSSSHAEGFGTKASGATQHVQGKYNAEDADGKYAHIVGNGNSNSGRSNAHTLDWNGVPWFQGRPQFGGNAQDDGSQTVMANGDAEIILTSSTEGSSKQFKVTVDDAGMLSVTDVESGVTVSLVQAVLDALASADAET